MTPEYRKALYLELARLDYISRKNRDQQNRVYEIEAELREDAQIKPVAASPRAEIKPWVSVDKNGKRIDHSSLKEMLKAGLK